MNRASDNAAGSAISEKMRAQIRGLQQADRNIKDGVSLIQTTEAALGQIQNPNLIRMRELVIQAANDTLSFQDKQVIQNELDQIKQSIGDIVENTEFNTIKVLRPPVVNVPVGSISGMTDIVFLIDSTGSMGGPIANVKANITNFVNSISSAGINIQLGLVDYNDGVSSKVYPFTTDLEDFKNSLNTISVSGGGDTPEAGLEAIQDALGISMRSDASKQFVLVTDAPVHDNNDGDGGDGLSIYDIEEMADKLKAASIKLNIVGPTDSETQEQLMRLSPPTNGQYLNIYSEFSNELNKLAKAIIEDAQEPNEEDKMFPLKIQVGPNAGQQISIPLYDHQIEKLELQKIDVLSHESATASLVLIDNISKLISSRRGEYGAYQNRLEHALANVQNYEVNLTNALSGIEDVDMALETQQLAKNSILLQSSQTMIAQINKISQGILEILK
ncbi:flagellin [Psychrobacillus psychrotolerans]|uniref:flagellin n=1 Tax=Psychrobacillus psychrotolerans TaxID=126156 RepID=UPI0024820275|nr:flagellin [Psychrobacillus psychrotolerans]